MSRCCTAALRQAVLLALLLVSAGSCRAETGLQVLRLGTGGIGGTYFPLGSIIAQAVSEPRNASSAQLDATVPGLLVVAQISNGSVANLEAMRKGLLDAALVQADVVYWAHHGSGLYAQAGPDKDIRAVAYLYPESLHLVARIGRDIQSVADLRGKRVSLDEAGSGTLHDARLILRYYGLEERDMQVVYLKPHFAALAVARGDLDAFFTFAGYPAEAVSSLAVTSGARLLPIDGPVREKILSAHPYFERGVIPAGIYGAGVIPADTYKNNGATPTLTVGAQLVVTATLDEDLVYRLTRALWHPRTLQRLREGHPRAATIDPRQALTGIGVPLHPGAERYYREVGLLPAEAE